MIYSIKEALAKSKGVKLITHNKNVSIVAEYIAKKTILNLEHDVLIAIKFGAILHDIGKIIIAFQELLLGKAIKTNQKYRHNEIGWAFIVKYLNLENEFIGNSVYWHHGISNKMGIHSCEDILDGLSYDDIENLKTLIIELIGETFLKSENEIYQTLKKSPNYYMFGSAPVEQEYNRKFSLIRTCIISADRIVSQLEEGNVDLLVNSDNVSSYIDNILDDILYRDKTYVIDESPYSDVVRFDSQKKISRLASIIITTIVNAPAGFGKTLVGVMWALLSRKKLIWVCPRNTVAESVYDSILRELDVLGLSHITVELFLTGKREASNHDNSIEFSSDIIVTNIDNFEKPTIDDGIANRLFMIYSANVVFDEYHEFVAIEPYFAAFINIMKIRNRNTDAKTLLLSATPLDISYMWDSLGNPTQILPSKNTHYPAVHSTPFTLRVEDEFNYRGDGSDFIIFNSISEAQYMKSKLPNAMLYHSAFTKEAKIEKYQDLMMTYGKEMIDGEIQIKLNNLQTVIGTPIMQSSLDISCKSAYDSCLSPDATMQRLGRENRHDDYKEGELIFTVFKLRNRKKGKKYSQAESNVVDLLYDEKLMELWFQDLLQYNGKRMTLDEFYIIYNNHNIKYVGERKAYFDKRYGDSLYNLSLIYPIKYNEKKRKKGIITAGSNKLRSLGSETFFLAAKYNNPNEYVGLFNCPIYRSHDLDFNEKGNIRTRLLGSMKTIMKNENTEFDYSEILKNKKDISIDEIRRLGKKSDTPYIRYDVVYHPEYGLITTERLNEFGR